MKFLVDENVSQAVIEKLISLGHEALSVAEELQRAVKDPDIYKLAVSEDAILITRDHHLTNPIRYPTRPTKGIIYIRHGNFTSEQEASLVENFVTHYDLETIEGHLVTLYRNSIRMRPPSPG